MSERAKVKIDVYDLIEGKLREGETGESVVEKLEHMAIAWTRRDFRGTLQFMHLTADNWRQLCDAVNRSKSLRKRYGELLRYHYIGWIAEAGLHELLGKDWHLIFEFNDPTIPATQPDGVLDDGTTYDVKARIKNREGLTVRSPLCGLYVLCHYYEQLFHYVGYATREEVQTGRRVYGNYTLPVHKMHPIYFFYNDWREGLQYYVNLEIEEWAEKAVSDSLAGRPPRV